MILFFFFFNDTATTEIYTLSLHDALPISAIPALNLLLKILSYVPSGPKPLTPYYLRVRSTAYSCTIITILRELRSEEHTSELQSRQYLVCRLLLEKKKKIKYTQTLRQTI